jgi:predicted O-linked N-acetylglucosamine transferase (SPINDLY family)
MAEQDQLIEQAIECFRSGRWSEAEDACRRMLARHAQDVSALHILGASLLNLGKVEEAVAYCREAISLDPRWAPPHFTLGMALERLGQPLAAIESYRRSLQLGGGDTPTDQALSCNTLGAVFQSLGRIDEAATCYVQALEIEPGNPRTHNNLGVILHARGDRAGAMARYTEALRLQPNFAEAWVNLGNLLRLYGRLEEALEAYGRSAAIKPDYATAYYNVGVVQRDLGHVPNAIACYRRALELRPDYEAANSAVLYAMQFDPATTTDDLMREHLAWAQRFAPPVAEPGHRNDPDPDRPLRIGYVSPHFRDHAVTFFSEPILEHHDRERFHVTCYSQTTEPPDAVTQRLRSRCAAWRETAAMSDQQLAEQIRADGIDVLVDLAGHLGHNRLRALALRPAPVQVTYLGYQATTGLSAINYRLTDAHADPPGMTESQYVERLARLPESFFCYRPAEDAPAVSSQPATEKGYVSFGFLNHLAKLSEPMVAAVAKILAQVEGSQFLILTHGAESFRAAMRARFAAHGVEGERIQFLQRGARRQYLEHYASIDIALDPFPFCGHTTTCDGLWQGVPAVTLAGANYAGRMGVSVMANLALEQWIAKSPHDYVARAARMAGDLDALRALRASMRDRMRSSVLLDGARFTRQLEAAYRAMWHRWSEHRRRNSG